MSDGTLGYGATLTLCATTSFTTVTTIGNIISVSGPNETREMIDYSNMDSTSKWREKIPGMLDAGDITIEMNYDGAAAGTANDIAVEFTNVTQYWRITFNDHTQATNKSRFQSAACITGISFSAPYEDKVTQTLTLSCTGVPSYTDAG